MRLTGPNRSRPAGTSPLLGAITLPSGPLSVIEPWLASVLRGCTPGAVHEAMTLFRELLDNAHRHAEPPYRARVHALYGTTSIRLEVDDASPVTETPWAAGKGLLIVRGLCEAWGVHACDGGKTVWAVLPLLVGPGSQAGGPAVRVDP